jgi:hypothetical protein
MIKLRPCDRRSFPVGGNEALELGFGEEYVAALRRELTPVIVATSMEAMNALAHRWAREVAGSLPEQAGPFPTGPYGEHILADDGASLRRSSRTAQRRWHWGGLSRRRCIEDGGARARVSRHGASRREPV